MKNLLMKYSTIALVIIISVIMGINFPETAVTFVFNGVGAFFILFLLLYIIINFFVVMINGGSMSYESKGLIGWIKELKQRKKGE